MKKTDRFVRAMQILNFVARAVEILIRIFSL